MVFRVMQVINEEINCISFTIDVFTTIALIKTYMIAINITRVVL